MRVVVHPEFMIKVLLEFMKMTVFSQTEWSKIVKGVKSNSEMLLARQVLVEQSMKTLGTP